MLLFLSTTQDAIKSKVNEQWIRFIPKISNFLAVSVGHRLLLHLDQLLHTGGRKIKQI